MALNHITYEFNTDTVTYPSAYDSTKLNLGWLMTSSIDTEGKRYVSPFELSFMRGYEVTNPAPISYPYFFNSMGFLKYDDDTIWGFVSHGLDVSTAKRIFFFTYKKSTNQIVNFYNSININPNPNTSQQCYGIQPTMDLHITGSVTVTGTQVTGSGTTWLTDGACVGNRIGFGSTSSADITSWYEISSIISNTNLVIKRGVATDGAPQLLNLTGSVPYVIEDFRISYVNYAGTGTAARGIILVKGLRPEIFTQSPSTIPAATTVDNLRACYRLVDGSTANATFIPVTSILEPKVSLTEQYLYTLSRPGATTISLQKFNIRASLSSSLTAGRASGSFIFSTGAQAHGGTNMYATDVMAKDNSGNYYVSHYTRISRIPTGSIVSGSTTFIANHMIENPPGGTGSFALSSQLSDICYMSKIDRLYISHEQGTIRNYISRFISGSQFETQVHANDQIQQSTYLVNKFETLTPNFDDVPLNPYYCDGVTFLVRDASNSNNNIIYALPLEADAQFESTSSACIITPELFTTSASAYTGIYVDSTDYFNTNRFALPRQPYYLYYRTSGISNNSGSWTYLTPSSSMPAASESIQFKLTFSTLGYYSMPSRVHGITITYSSSLPQQAVANYDMTPQETNIASQIFAWRQSSVFNTTPSNLNLNIYSGSTVILTDTVTGSLSGSWEYSTNAGNTWSSLTTPINSVGSYIRYTATPTLPSGSILKTVLYL